MEARGTHEKDHVGLAQAFTVLANPTRLMLLHRLATPAFVPDLEEELSLTRQALKKHLDALVEGGLVETRRTRRGVFSATEYAASARGLFAFKEAVLDLALPEERVTRTEQRTRPASNDSASRAHDGPGLLVLHGHRRGAWFPLEGAGPIVVGRDETSDIPLAWDPFASARHAALSRDGVGWSLTDLHARNGTSVNLQRVELGSTVKLANGDVIGLGRSLLVLRT